MLAGGHVVGQFALRNSGHNQIAGVADASRNANHSGSGLAGNAGGEGGRDGSIVHHGLGGGGNNNALIQHGHNAGAGQDDGGVHAIIGGFQNVPGSAVSGEEHHVGNAGDGELDVFAFSGNAEQLSDDQIVSIRDAEHITEVRSCHDGVVGRSQNSVVGAISNVGDVGSQGEGRGQDHAEGEDQSKGLFHTEYQPFYEINFLGVRVLP